MASGPPAAVAQILRMFTSPWPGLGVGLGVPPGTPSGAGPFAQLWETWTSSLVPPGPPERDKAS